MVEIRRPRRYAASASVAGVVSGMYVASVGSAPRGHWSTHPLPTTIQPLPSQATSFSARSVPETGIRTRVHVVASLDTHRNGATVAAAIHVPPW